MSVDSANSDEIVCSLVVILSLRCNLSCTYCNVEAGPSVEGEMGLVLFEQWLKAFLDIDCLSLSVQLHGGEPLALKTDVEWYARVARNTFAQYPSWKYRGMGLVTNGSLLDDARAKRLTRAGVQMQVSVDGPELIHNSRRINESGRGNHKGAMHAVELINHYQSSTGIISVITNPDEVLPAVNFFIESGISAVKMNPMRPEGRALVIPGWRQRKDEPAMRPMAQMYLAAAKRIAEHNRAHPNQPFYEDNIFSLVSRIAEKQSGGPRANEQSSNWTLLLDENGSLWGHPGAQGIDGMRLAEGKPATSETIRAALGLVDESDKKISPSVQVATKRRATFQPCANCNEPEWCSRFAPPIAVLDNVPNPTCEWRNELTDLLSDWLDAEPEAMRHLLYPYLDGDFTSSY